MDQQIHDTLKRVARAQTITTYGQIAPLAGLHMSRADHRARMAEILDEISGSPPKRLLCVGRILQVVV